MNEKKYIGVKVVKATPITLNEFKKQTGRDPYANNLNPAEDLQNGYAVTYEDNYVGYSPKSVFEKSYKEIDNLNINCLGVISTDYKERFKSEYYALKERYTRLKNMCAKWDEGTLNFKPTCTRDIYDEQLRIMAQYMQILEHRAKCEDITL